MRETSVLRPCMSLLAYDRKRRKRHIPSRLQDRRHSRGVMTTPELSAAVTQPNSTHVGFDWMPDIWLISKGSAHPAYAYAYPSFASPLNPVLSPWRSQSFVFV